VAKNRDVKYVEGVVEYVHDSGGRYAVRLDDGEWYSAFDIPPPWLRKGVRVKIGYVTRGGFKNIVEINPMVEFEIRKPEKEEAKGMERGVPPDVEARKTALELAVKAVTSSGVVDIDEIISVAKRFLDFLEGREYGGEGGGRREQD